MIRSSIACLLMIAGNGLSAQNNSDWTELFNGKDLSGWNTYLEIELDSAGNKMGTVPLGFNKDPQKVFSVIEEENMIRISGQTWGAVSTDAEYQNYHLYLRFKWGKLKWAEKRDSPMDSGLLYHSIGAPVLSGWLTSHEFQVEENHCGDYWTIGKVRQTIPNSRYHQVGWSYDPHGEFMDFSWEGDRRCPRAAGMENLSGEWNTLELHCFEDTSVHVLNGQVVMVLYKSRHYMNGPDMPLTKGRIQLQSEGAEVYYKDIRIRRISSLNHLFIRNK